MKNVLIAIAVIIVLVVIGMVALPKSAGYIPSTDTTESDATISTEAQSETVAPVTEAQQAPAPKAVTPIVPETTVSLPGGDVQSQDSEQMTPQTAVQRPTEFAVRYTDNGFTPTSIAARPGDAVIFTNDSALTMWVASNFHPIHSAYPGSGLSKCGGAEAARIFDACQGVGAGGTYRFTFSEIGSWGYHNHLRPSHGGIVTIAK